MIRQGVSLLWWRSGGSNTPTIRASSRQAVSNFWRYLRISHAPAGCCELPLRRRLSLPLAESLPASSSACLAGRFLRLPGGWSLWPGAQRPGTIVISTSQRRLYFVLGNGQAIQYGVGVGRPGFTWTGNQDCQREAGMAILEPAGRDAAAAP